ncbi:hypothetical protein AcW1_005954 [Taiwanofungus camphoratus]|nr:hypothetical protein AcW2_004707 [Antrodia cinnamomea]KAI0934427.1 hypothetical protein AcV5_006271 [Antrodia cinnamomea]KAI0950286.1 hypothetical protein AcV7_008802 [Antrodia cinnamomea]KAI0957622.1 hypothetical protein AcW1_005954 [Antrodia cinnamomea]
MVRHVSVCRQKGKRSYICVEYQPLSTPRSLGSGSSFASYRSFQCRARIISGSAPYANGISLFSKDGNPLYLATASNPEGLARSNPFLQDTWLPLLTLTSRDTSLVT